LLATAVFAGVAFMLFAGAPAHFPSTNGGALLVALAAILWTEPPERARLGIAFAAAALLWAPLLLTGDIDGVRRWIGVGPVRLHSGMLAVPPLIAAMAKLDGRVAAALAATSALAVALQPDRAAALALLAGLVALWALRPGRWSALSIGVGLAGLATALTQPDPLAPVAFVEHVITDAWRIAPGLSAAIALSIVALIVAPSVACRSFRPLAAVSAGFFIASCFGHFPVPFTGYGAASILGFGLAAAMLGDGMQAPGRSVTIQADANRPCG
jgi:hypothetical protein